MARTMKVRFRESWSAAGKRFAKGDVVQLDLRLARTLCNNGRAERMGDNVPLSGTSILDKSARMRRQFRRGAPETQAVTPAEVKVPEAVTGESSVPAWVVGVPLADLAEKLPDLGRKKLRELCKHLGVSQTGNPEELRLKAAVAIDSLGGK